ncbi:MAG TPA: 3-oxoacyl-ACP synthase, partial [Acidimicrobiales bacterium]|nr:3-oxoacyl-ACP synthase [Acidimicrobiales bacterium]
MPSGAITGWGSALPDQVVTNADLEARLDTTDQWIRERSGIRERRVGGTTSGLAVDATQRALDRAGVAPSQVDLLVLSTNTPDQPVPATAAVIQSKLGLAGGAVDLNSGCSGFVYGLVMANGLIATGLERVILTASDTVSRIVDPEDRSTAVLFGDAAGAVVLEAVPGPTLLGWDLGSDGAAAPFPYQERGKFLYMDGREVYRRAVRATAISARAALDRAKVEAEDIAL